MNNHLISIIIPVYNSEKYLQKCIGSITNQTYKNLEIICVNDGSIDKSLNILKELAKVDERLIIINQNNSGVSYARNAGLDRSTGEFILFVDADDWVELNTCEFALETLMKYNSDLVFWSYIREYKYNALPKSLFQDQIINFTNLAQIEELIVRILGPIDNSNLRPEGMDSLVTVWGKLYKSKIIKDNNIQFIELSIIGSLEDALFNLDYFNKMTKAIYFNKFLHHYRKDNDSSITTKYRPHLIEQWDNLYNRMNMVALNISKDGKYLKALNNRMAFSIVGLGLNEVSSSKNMKEKIRNITRILERPIYKNALKQLCFENLPIHWFVFFLLAKFKRSVSVFIMLKIISIRLRR